jgi:zinc/manganese transport system ATP-binding protein
MPNSLHWPKRFVCSSEMHTDTVALQFSDVTAVRGRRQIWSHATFEVPAGGIVAVIGGNGSGKTTLLQIILGLIPVASGEVLVFDQRPGADSRIGYVPQDYAASAGDAVRAADTVLLGLIGHRWAPRRATAAQRRQVQHTMDAVGAGDLADERLANLSGGQRQRVAIAEALVDSPQMLILDEPLASLDLRSQRELVELLHRLHSELGMTILVVAHDLNPLLPIVDSAIYLLDGRAHYAPIDDVVNAEVLTELYGTPMEVLRTSNDQRFTRSAL